MSVYNSTFTSTMCFSMDNTSLKKKDRSPKLVALWSHGRKKRLCSLMLVGILLGNSAYIMLIMPIIPSKDLEYVGISVIPTHCVYLLPRAINSLFVCVSGPVNLIVYWR